MFMSAFIAIISVLFFFQITVENSPEVVPNGHILADTVKETDLDAETSFIALNGAAAHLAPNKGRENNDGNGQQEVIPAEVKDVAEVEQFRQVGEMTVNTSCLLISEKKIDNGDMNGHHEVVAVVERDKAEAGRVQLNGEVTVAKKKQGPPTKKRERETQTMSLVIDDDGDDVEDETTSSTSDSHASGADAERFAANRPRAWRHNLNKKREEAVGERALDRQVCLSACLLCTYERKLKSF